MTAQDPEDKTLRQVDRWIIVAAVIIAITLIGASLLRPESADLYFQALGGLTTIVVLYWMFGRSGR